jgi:hypothetical protein
MLQQHFGLILDLGKLLAGCRVAAMLGDVKDGLLSG